MRLTITLPELEQGWSNQSRRSEDSLELKILSGNRSPVAIAPIKDHDHRLVSAVVLTEDAEHCGSTVKIYFRPIWCRMYTLCSAKKDSLLALILQFEDEQYWVDRDGWRPSHLTVEGPGTDPKTVYNSQFMLGDLLANYPRPHLFENVVELIRKKYLLCQEEKRKKDAILT
jgi:hypothetical protein